MITTIDETIAVLRCDRSDQAPKAIGGLIWLRSRLLPPVQPIAVETPDDAA